jgi:hypothetical protein
MQEKINYKQLDPSVAVHRAPVRFAAAGLDFASGTIDVSGAPFFGAGNVNIDDDILSITPATDDDNGVFRVTAVNIGLDQATVVPRADSIPGSRFTRGEEVFVLESEASYRASSVQDVSGEVGFADLAPSVFVRWLPLHEFIAEKPILPVTGFGEKVVVITAPGTTNVDYDVGIVFVDATTGNITLSLSTPLAAFQTSFGVQFSKRYTIRRIDASGNTVGVVVTGSIDGNAISPQATIGPSGNLSIVNNGTDWYSV